LKINLIRNESKELAIEFETTEFTIPDLLADELLEDPNVEFAGASKDHPETGKPVLVIRGKKDPRASLLAAIGRIDDNLAKLKSQIPKK
jgi:DNA-directed RNA polymerase subunit L